MSVVQAAGQEPYPEPSEPPPAPQETPPIDTPSEEPPMTPFNDDGRTVDAISPLSIGNFNDGFFAA